jgi:large subunit ribosomal protein L30
MRPRAKRNDGARRLRVRLVKSWIGYEERQEKIVRGLGLRRIGHTVDVVDNASIRGMIRAVKHLVTSSEI